MPQRAAGFRCGLALLPARKAQEAAAEKRRAEESQEGTPQREPMPRAAVAGARALLANVPRAAIDAISTPSLSWMLNSRLRG